MAIYTGNTSWIAKDLADAQAAITVQKLGDAGIPVTLYSDAADQAALADWVAASTGNGKLDVLILYGYLPDTIYPAGNAVARWLHRRIVHRVHRRGHDHQPRRLDVLRLEHEQRR